MQSEKWFWKILKPFCQKRIVRRSRVFTKYTNIVFRICVILFIVVTLQGCGKESTSNLLYTLEENGYAYAQLEDNEKLVYLEMREAIESHSESVVLSTKNIEMINHVYLHLLADHGEYFWLSGYTVETKSVFNKTTEIEFFPQYTMDKKRREVNQTAIDDVVTDILKYVSIDLPDYDKAKFVFGYLSWNIEYSSESINSQNIISVFLDKESVCQGYASATQYLLRKLGIESTVVTGKAGNEKHAWNLIHLDGDYYYMDTTWGSDNAYSSQGEPYKYMQYRFMCMNDKQLSMTHVTDVCFELPPCYATEDTYYIKEGLYFERADYDKMAEIFADTYLNKNGSEVGCNSVSFMFANAWLAQDAIDYFVVQGKLAECCEGIEQINCIQNDMAHIVIFIF